MEMSLEGLELFHLHEHVVPAPTYMDCNIFIDKNPIKDHLQSSSVLCTLMAHYKELSLILAVRRQIMQLT